MTAPMRTRCLALLLPASALFSSLHAQTPAPLENQVEEQITRLRSLDNEVQALSQRLGRPSTPLPADPPPAPPTTEPTPSTTEPSATAPTPVTAPVEPPTQNTPASTTPSTPADPNSIITGTPDLENLPPPDTTPHTPPATELPLPGVNTPPPPIAMPVEEALSTLPPAQEPVELSSTNNEAPAAKAQIKANDPAILDSIPPPPAPPEPRVSPATPVAEPTPSLSETSSQSAPPTPTTKALPDVPSLPENSNIADSDAPKSKSQDTPGKHVIQPGDTFAALSRQHGIPIAALIKANPKANPKNLKLGETIILPLDAAIKPEKTASQITKTPTPKNTTPATSASAQPEPATKNTQNNGAYTIQAGDTLHAIARKHGTTVEALRRANNITNPAGLQVGTTIKLPVGSNTAANKTEPSAANASSVNKSDNETTAKPRPKTPGTYIVKPGETLYNIARQTGTPIEELRKVNKIVGDTIHPGQSLKVRRNSAPNKEVP